MWKSGRGEIERGGEVEVEVVSNKGIEGMDEVQILALNLSVTVNVIQYEL